MRRADRSMAAQLEWGSALFALAIAFPIAAIVAGRGVATVGFANAVGFLVSVFLGPLLAAIGSWFDVRRGQASGVLLLVLAALLSFDGMVATYFACAPLFVLVLATLLIAIWRRRFARASSPH